MGLRVWGGVSLDSALCSGLGAEDSFLAWVWAWCLRKGMDMRSWTFKVAGFRT